MSSTPARKMSPDLAAAAATPTMKLAAIRYLRWLRGPPGTEPDYSADFLPFSMNVQT